MSLVKLSSLALALTFLPAAPVSTAGAPAPQGGSGLCWVAPGSSHDNGLVKVGTSASSQAWVSVSPCSYDASDASMTIVDARAGVPSGEPWNGFIDTYGGAGVDVWMDELATGSLVLRGSAGVSFNSGSCGGLGIGLPYQVQIETFHGLGTELWAKGGCVTLNGHAFWNQWPPNSYPPIAYYFGSGHEIKPGESWDNGAVKVVSTNSDPQSMSAWIWPEHVSGQTHSWWLGTQTIVYIAQGYSQYGGPYWSGTVEGVDRDDMVSIGDGNGTVTVTGRGGWITMGWQTAINVVCLPESPTSPNQGIHVDGPFRWWIAPNGFGSVCLCD